MSVFEYKAIDSNGKESAGILESDSLKSARYALQSQHLTVVEVTKSKRKLSQSKSWFEVTLSMMDVSLFVRQLASLLQASMPIDEALQTIATHSDKKYIKKTIQKIPFIDTVKPSKTTVYIQQKLLPYRKTVQV